MMKVTFYYDKLVQPRVFSADNCTFDFITESYHSFLLVSDGHTIEQKKTLKLTFEK